MSPHFLLKKYLVFQRRQGEAAVIMNEHIARYKVSKAFYRSPDAIIINGIFICFEAFIEQTDLFRQFTLEAYAKTIKIFKRDAAVSVSCSKMTGK